MVTETTEQGWFSRIGSALKGMLVGGILFLVSMPLLFWNEGRAVKTARSLDEGEGAVVSVEAADVDAANDLKLVHLSGLATTDEILRDDDFKIEANGIRLNRVAEMYQWKENSETETDKTVGGKKTTTTTYTYETEWSSSLIDSGGFRESTGHQNPSSMPLSGRVIRADNVALGAFRLTPGMVGKISGSEPLTVTQDSIPESFQDRMQLSGSTELYLGEDPQTPAVGDTRVRFSVTRPAEITVIAQQRGESFGAFETSNGYTIDMLRSGTHNVAEMFAMARSDNTFLTWLIRAGGTIAMFAGLMFLMAPLAVIGDFIPLVGSIVSGGSFIISLAITMVLASMTIALAWVFYRPIVAIPLVCIAVFGVYLLIKRRKPAVPVAAAAVDQLTEADLV